MKRFFSGIFIVMLVLGTTCLFSKVKVGEEVLERFETQHPYVGKKGVVWEQVFHWPNAGYIAIHFSQFDLANGDRMEISSPDGKFRYMFKEKGKDVYRKKGKKKQISEFWATHIPGDTAVVRLISKNKKNAFGFVIDKWARGYEKGYIQALLEEEEGAFIEDICRFDDREWAKCYEGTDMYNKARAVCRLLILPDKACTGWLLGSEGHVMTTNQCIGTQNLAVNTDYEFMAEGETCTTDCAYWMACRETVPLSSGMLIKTNPSLDYSLILLPANVTSTYGYLQFRNELPTVGERIYIPQHADGWGKQLTVLSDVGGGEYAKIWSTNEPPCTGGGGDIGYHADTAEGGSSGSPVLAYDDHLVVALNHCGDCPNRGVPIPDIITALGDFLPNNAIGGFYCELSGENQDHGWIKRVQAGDLDHISGPSPYSDFTYLVANLEPDTSANVTLTPGFAGSPINECWDIWIDYNGDKYFDDDDEHVFSGSGTSDVTGSFLVRPDASGQTRMRVSMRWRVPCPLSPPSCGTFQLGEVEDYTVNFVDYCDSSGQFQDHEWIAGVQVGDLDNNSESSPYSYFPLKKANIIKGYPVDVELTPGFADRSYDECWKIWIDYNQDGDFSEIGEEVFSGCGDSIDTSVTGSFDVLNETWVLPGKTRMRVSMQYLDPPPVCGEFNYGEVEDYTANISDPIQTEADFIGTPTSGMAPLTVQFTDQSTNNPTQWEWTFEGGTPGTSEDQNLTVTYNTAGTYDVTLIATNPGGSDTKTEVDYITVTAPPPPVADFTASSRNICEGQSVTFTDQSTNNPTQWEWTFEGGTPPDSTVQDPTVTYYTAGTYDVTLIATNPGGSDTKTEVDYITVTVLQPPEANFTASSTNIYEGQSVTFTDNSVPCPTDWDWTFEGGTPSDSEAQNPTVIYYTAGTYDVTLTVTNPADSDTEAKTDYITVSATPPGTGTVGITDVYGSTSTSANRRAMPFTMPENGTIESVTMYHNGGSGSMILAVYDGASLPANRLGVTPTTAVSGRNDWQTINLTNPAYVSSGTTIWLAWVYESNPGTRYQTGSPGRAQSTDTWSGGMPDPFGSSTQASYLYSIYATY